MARVAYVPELNADCALYMRLSGDIQDMAITFGVAENFEDVPGFTEYAAMFTAVANALKTQTPTVYTFVGFKASVGTSEAPPGPVYEGSLSIAGTLAVTDLVPQNSAILIRKNTILSGRRGKGRFYFPAVPENVVSNIGVLDASKVTNMSAVFESARTAVAALDEFLYMTLIHSYEGGLPPDPMAPTQLSSCVCQPIIATQRRRLRP